MDKESKITIRQREKKLHRLNHRRDQGAGSFLCDTHPKDGLPTPGQIGRKGNPAVRNAPPAPRRSPIKHSLPRLAVPGESPTPGKCLLPHSCIGEAVRLPVRSDPESVGVKRTAGWPAACWSPARAAHTMGYRTATIEKQGLSHSFLLFLNTPGLEKVSKVSKFFLAVRTESHHFGG